MNTMQCKAIIAERYAQLLSSPTNPSAIYGIIESQCREAATHNGVPEAWREYLPEPLKEDKDPFTVFGWNYDQWAIAAARFGITECKCDEDALRVRARWRELYMQQPNDVALHGVEPDKAHEFACGVMQLRPDYKRRANV